MVVLDGKRIVCKVFSLFVCLFVYTMRAIASTKWNCNIAPANSIHRKRWIIIAGVESVNACLFLLFILQWKETKNKHKKKIGDKTDKEIELRIQYIYSYESISSKFRVIWVWASNANSRIVSSARCRYEYGGNAVNVPQH